MSQKLVRRAAAVGVAGVLGQALTATGEVKLEAAEVADVHHIIGRGQMIPHNLLAVGAKAASKPYVQAAVLKALREDYMLVDAVPGGAPLILLRDEHEQEGKEEERDEEDGEAQQQSKEEGKEAEMQRRLLASSSSAPSALSSLRQRRGMHTQLPPVGQQPEGQLTAPAAAAGDEQEAAFERALKRLEQWQLHTDSQPSRSSASASATPPTAPQQQSARSEQADSVTPVDGDEADSALPLVEADSPRSAVAAVAAPAPAPAQEGFLEWLLRWFDSKISGIVGVLVPPTSATNSSAPASTSAASQHSAAAAYRLDGSRACAVSPAPASSVPASVPAAAAAARGAQMVAGVAAVVIVLAVVRRHSPAVFALVAKLLQG